MGKENSWRRSPMILAAAAAVAAGISVAHASNTTYAGASGGLWDTSGNWNNGIPTTGSDAYITESPGLREQFSVDFDDNYSTATAIGELVISSADFTTSVALNQTLSGDNLFSGSEFLGDSGGGAGEYVQSAATNAASGDLYLGFSGTFGDYYLSGGTLKVGVAAYVGYDGSGYFSQSAGTVVITGSDGDLNSLSLGEESGGTGTYILGGGSLTAAGYESVGWEGTGNFSQTGGINSASEAENIANSGVGTYSQSGGSNSAPQLFVGDGDSSGLYSLSNGTLSAAGQYIGNTSDGTFVQSGGTNVAGTLELGYYGGVVGDYQLSAGSLSNTLSQYVGYSGVGTFIQSGGTNSVSDNLYLGYTTNGTGLYSLSAGTAAPEYEYIGTSGEGTFVESGGTNAITDGLYLGYNTDSSGIYSLSATGSLTAAFAYVGYEGVGNFFQTGGAASFTSVTINSLSIGAQPDGIGMYSLSGGSVSAYTESLGSQGKGTFNQSSGTNSAYYFYIGSYAASSGLYSLSGGLLNGEDYLYVGYSGNGTFYQSGGTNSVVADLYLSYQPVVLILSRPVIHWNLFDRSLICGSLVTEDRHVDGKTQIA